MKEVGRIIQSYRKKAKLTQPELAAMLKEEAGISITNKAISAWESGVAEPSVTTFLYVCRILQIPDFLESYFGNNPANPMAVLNEDGKAMVKSYIDQLAHPVSYLKELTPVYGDEVSKGKIVEFPTEVIKNKVRKKAYYARVSAGTGDFLDSDEFTWIDVDEDIADKFDFAVTVHGDSMEPDFHDHDMVYVKQQNKLENGQIGIFCLNDEAYIKKFRSDEDGNFLLSLNPTYDPIPVNMDNDSFRIFGRVVARQ